MLLPSKKNKEDNIYASAQSVSSGITGLVLTFIGTVPFKKGADYTMKVIKRYNHTFYEALRGKLMWGTDTRTEKTLPHSRK